MSTIQMRPGSARNQAARRYFLVRLFGTFIGVLVLVLGAVLVSQVLELRGVLEAGDLERVVTSSARWLALGVLFAFPVLYLVGGRSLARRFADAEDRAAHDALTGLNNDAAFREALQHEVARTERFHYPFTLAVVDVDEFAEFNEAFGHERADNLLLELAGALRTGRSVDLPFRVGGDEFAVIMPHTDLEGASWAVKRIRQEARQRMGETSVSVGLAVFDPAVLDCETVTGAAVVLRDHADLALHEAKRRGRDGVVSYTEIEGTMPSSVSAASIAAVRHLVRGRAMTVEYQPIWDLGSHELLGLESRAAPGADYGIDPVEVHDAARWLGLLDELGSLGRRVVLDGVGQLPAGVTLYLPIAAALLVRHDPGQLRGEVLAAGLDPARIVLAVADGEHEVVESIVRATARARELGFRLALAGFGSGSGSGSRRAELELLGAVRPVAVKVDRALAAARPPAGASVLETLLRAARSGGAMVIVEHLDTAEQLSELVAAVAALDARSGMVGGDGGGPGVGGQGNALGAYRAGSAWSTASAPAWPGTNES